MEHWLNYCDAAPMVGIRHEFYPRNHVEFLTLLRPLLMKWSRKSEPYEVLVPTKERSFEVVSRAMGVRVIGTHDSLWAGGLTSSERNGVDEDEFEKYEDSLETVKELLGEVVALAFKDPTALPRWKTVICVAVASFEEASVPPLINDLVGPVYDAWPFEATALQFKATRALSDGREAVYSASASGPEKIGSITMEFHCPVAEELSLDELTNELDSLGTEAKSHFASL